MVSVPFTNRDAATSPQCFTQLVGDTLGIKSYSRHTQRDVFADIESGTRTQIDWFDRAVL